MLIILALAEEGEYLHDVLADRTGWSSSTPRPRYQCVFQADEGPVQVVVQTMPGMGNIEATLAAGASIAQTQPDLVIMVGLAGSMHPGEVQLGDVVISNQAKWYSSDKVRALTTPPTRVGIRHYRFQDDPPHAEDDVVVDRRDATMTNSFLRYERKVVHCTTTDPLIGQMELKLRTCVGNFQRVVPELVPDAHRKAYSSRRVAMLHSGWILASQHVVDSAEYRQYLLEKNEDFATDIHRQVGDHHRSDWRSGKLLAVDMESYGLLRAVEQLRTTPAVYGGVPNLLGGIVVRGISDLCEEKSESDRGSGNETRRTAVRNATEVALRIIESLDYETLSAR